MQYPSFESNNDIVEEFLQWKRSKANYPKILYMFTNDVGKPLTDVDELDICRFLELHELKAGTWNVWLSILRQFYKWFYNKHKHNNDEHMPPKKWKAPAFFDLIECKVSIQSRYGPGDMWSEEEILMAISVLDHPRDKAMLAMLYDLAARPHELMKLKIKDVVLKENYAQVKLVDHTGERVVPITLSFPYVLTWLNNHPLKEHHDAPLWVKVDKTPTKIGYPALYRLCTSVLKSRIGHKIMKPFNPYCVGDHSRLTNLVERGISEYELKRFRGWKPNSNMPSRYIHMSGRSLNEKLLEIAGIKKPQQEKESSLNAKKCFRCSHGNAPDAKYCEKCNFMLDPTTWEEVKKSENKYLERIERLEKDVELIGRWLGKDSRVQILRRQAPKEDEDKYLVVFHTGYDYNKKSFNSNNSYKVHEYCH